MTERALRISTTLSIPAEAVTQAMAILAIRGVGKTYTALVLAEEMVKAGWPVVIADPVGVCWGLRVSADGKGPGLPVVILGGEHGDVPLDVTAGDAVAEYVIESRQPVVLDLSLFRKGEQVRFMTDFAERLYHSNREPLHLILDEADAFAPQKPQKGQERMLGAVEDLVRRGRARGLGITMVTQRSAVLNKDVLTQVEVLIAMRTIAPQDRAAIEAWIRVHGTPEQQKVLMASLASLPKGTAWIWSPGWLDLFQRVKIRQRETFDSSATPSLRAGRARHRTWTFREVDLEGLRTRMSRAIEQAQEKDPKWLRHRVGELQAEIVRLTDLTDQQRRDTQRIEVPVLTDKDKEWIAEQIETLSDTIAKADEALRETHAGIDERLGRAEQGAREAIAKLTQLTEPIRNAGSALARWNDPGAKMPRRPLPTPPEHFQSRSDVAPNLRSGEVRMLETAARHYPVHLTRSQLGALARFSPSGGTFGQYLGNLKRQMLLEEANDGISVTARGFAMSGITKPQPMSRKEIVETWRNALRRGERVMLDALLRNPRGMSRESLSREANMAVTGGTFGQYLGTLRRNGLAEVDGDLVSLGSVFSLDNS